MNISFIYNRGDSFPGNTVLNNRFSRHHIISYPMMRCFAEVLLQFEKKEIVTADKELREKYEKFNRAYTGQNMDEKKNRIAWAYSNLFIGPSSKYREDDPSQKMDKIPISFPEKRAILAKNVKLAWNKISSSYIVGESDTEISLKISENKNDVKTFLSTFIDYILDVRTEGAIHVTRLNDWVVKPDTSQSGEYYHFYFRNVRDGEVSQNYGFYLYERSMSLGKGLVAITKFDDSELSGIHNSKTKELAPDSTFDCVR